MIVKEGIVTLDTEVCEECRQAEEAFQEWKKDCTEKSHALIAATVFFILAVVVGLVLVFSKKGIAAAEHLFPWVLPALFLVLAVGLLIMWWMSRGELLRGHWFGVSTDSKGKNHIHHTTGGEGYLVATEPSFEPMQPFDCLFVPTPGMREDPSGKYLRDRKVIYPDTSSIRIEAAESFSLAQSLARALHTVNIKYGEQLGMSEGASVNVLTERVFDQSFALLHKFPLDWLNDAAAAEAKEEGVALGLITLANCMKQDPRVSQPAADGRIVLTALINALPRFRFWIGTHSDHGVKERVERMYGEQVAYSINRRG